MNIPELDTEQDEIDAQDLDLAIRRWINVARTHDVISFSYYRRLRKDYQGWQPVSLKEYRLKLRKDQVAIKKFREDLKRQAHNERVQSKIDNENPFLGLI